MCFVFLFLSISLFLSLSHSCSFTLWALLFVIARLLTLTLSVLTFSFGLPRIENQGFSFAEGNFNVLTVRWVPVGRLLVADYRMSSLQLCLPLRMSCLAAICLTQAWMMWKFINFQLKKWREHSQNQATKRKTVSPKNKPHKRDPARGECSSAAAATIRNSSDAFEVKRLCFVSSGGATNGVVKSDDKTSPRARKAKTS